MFAGVPSAASAVPPVSFGPRTTFEAGRNPYQIAFGYLNDDDYLDLAVTNYVTYASGYWVSVMMGDGAGGFGPKADYETGTSPNSVFIGDLNHDSKSDVATAIWGSATTVGVMLGDGMGSFGPTSYSCVDEIDTVSAKFIDVNGDGNPDLVGTGIGCGYTCSAVEIALGDGAGGFGPVTLCANDSLGPRTSSIAVGDLDGDDKPDLVIPMQDRDSVWVVLGDGLGGFVERSDFPTGDGPSSVAIGDLNNDDLPDLAVVSKVGRTVSIFLGDGTGGFDAGDDFATGADPLSPVISDLNGDDELDVAVANNADSTVSVLLGNGDGSLGNRNDFVVGEEPTVLVIDDLNDDGEPDLAVTNWTDNTISVLLNNSTVGVEPGSPDTRLRVVTSPNPFGKGITIEFELPISQHASLAIYDLSGRRLRDLRSGLLLAGNHRIAWNGLDDGGKVVGAGIYFARLDVAGQSLGTKVVRLE